MMFIVRNIDTALLIILEASENEQIENLVELKILSMKYYLPESTDL